MKRLEHASVRAHTHSPTHTHSHTHTPSPVTDCADVASCTTGWEQPLMSGKRERARKFPRRYVRKHWFYQNNIQLLQLDDGIKLFRISTHPSLVALNAAELRHWTLFQSCVEHEAVVIPSILYLTSSHSRDEVIAKNARHVCCSLIGCCISCGRSRRKWAEDDGLINSWDELARMHTLVKETGSILTLSRHIEISTSNETCCHSPGSDHLTNMYLLFNPQFNSLFATGLQKLVSVL